MVVTSRAIHGQPEEDLAGGGDDVVELIEAREFLVRGVVVPDPQAVESRGDDPVGTALRKFVTGQLLAKEPIVGFVLVEGPDDVVAVSPGMGLGVVRLVAVGLCEAHEIQPMAAPTSRHTADPPADGPPVVPRRRSGSATRASISSGRRNSQQVEINPGESGCGDLRTEAGSGVAPPGDSTKASTGLREPDVDVGGVRSGTATNAQCGRASLGTGCRSAGDRGLRSVGTRGGGGDHHRGDPDRRGGARIPCGYFFGGRTATTGVEFPKWVKSVQLHTTLRSGSDLDQLGDSPDRRGSCR